MVREGALPLVVMAMPDGFTRLGGNQYVDTPVLGRWSGFPGRCVAPALEARFGCGGDGRRGLLGKFLRRYGALVNAIRPAGRVGGRRLPLRRHGVRAVLLARPSPPRCGVLARHDGSIEGFLEAFHASDKPKGDEVTALMMLAMAGSYDPDPQGSPLVSGCRRPGDLRSHPGTLGPLAPA